MFWILLDLDKDGTTLINLMMLKMVKEIKKEIEIPLYSQREMKIKLEEGFPTKTEVLPRDDIKLSNIR